MLDQPTVQAPTSSAREKVFYPTKPQVRPSAKPSITWAETNNLHQGKHNGSLKISTRDDSMMMPSEGSGESDESEEGGSYASAVRSILQAQGVTESEQEAYAEMAIASGVKGEALQSLPTSGRASQVILISADDLPKFSGEVEDYQEFKTDFLTQLPNFLESQRLRLLKGCLDDESKQMIAICQGGQSRALCKAWEILDECYDQPELVKQILIERMRVWMNMKCAQDEKLFATVVRGVRNCYHRILLLDPLSVVLFESFRWTWMNNMPEELKNSLSKLSYFEREKFNFTRVLKDAEGHVGWKRSESRRMLACPSKEPEPCKKVESFDASPGRIFAEEGSQADCSRMDQKYTPSIPPEQVDQAHFKAEFNPASRGGKLQPEFPLARVMHKCYLCKNGDAGDHYTISCKKELSEEELGRISKEEELCYVCGEPGHWGRQCTVVRVAGEEVLCRLPQCSEEFHTKTGRFCILCRKQK